MVQLNNNGSNYHLLNEYYVLIVFHSHNDLYAISSILLM